MPLLLLAFPGYSHGLVVTLVNADRGVRASAQAGTASDFDQHTSHLTGSFIATANASATSPCSSPPFCFTSSANATASQSTDLTLAGGGLGVSGNLQASSSTNTSFLGPSASASSLSYVDLIFNLDTPAQYTFGFTDYESFGSSAYLTMQNLDTSAWVLYGATLPFNGTTGGGNYEFHFWADDYYGASNLDFSFDLAAAPAPGAVPEPTTLLLLGLGLAGTGLVRRRRQ
jgi:hypothetical protein